MNTVSVIIPCYNVEDYIEECLQSVFQQTHPPVEVICVDNNSTDETLNKLHSIQANRHPELIIFNESVRGAAAARNRGLSEAQGKWIQFLDADDLLKPGKIAEQVRLINNLTFTPGFVIGNSEKNHIDGSITPPLPVHSDRFLAPFINQAGNTCANLWLRESLIHVGGWDVNLGSSQEADLMLRLVLAGSETIIDTSVNTVIRTRHSGQISQSAPVKRWRQLIETRLRFMHALKETRPSSYDEHKQVYLNYLMSTVLILGQHDRFAAAHYYELINEIGLETQVTVWYYAYQRHVHKILWPG